MGRLRPEIWISLLLVMLTVAAFAPVLGNDFVNYDDPEYVTRNFHVRAGITPEREVKVLAAWKARGPKP